MNDELLKELTAKIADNGATIDDCMKVIEIQNVMLKKQVQTTGRLLAVTERQQDQNEMLKEAHNHAMTAWLMNRHTPFEYGGSA